MVLTTGVPTKRKTKNQLDVCQWQLIELQCWKSLCLPFLWTSPRSVIQPLIWKCPIFELTIYKASSFLLLSQTLTLKTLFLLFPHRFQTIIQNWSMARLMHDLHTNNFSVYFSLNFQLIPPLILQLPLNQTLSVFFISKLSGNYTQMVRVGAAFPIYFLGSGPASFTVSYSVIYDHSVMVSQRLRAKGDNMGVETRIFSSIIWKNFF